MKIVIPKITFSLMANELGTAKSPYLIQHKDNPVHWKMWGDSAIKKAQNESKLIFLSIGYATCHWCHVMEHESFEDAEVADLLNKRFVSIKVDREEFPDVDQIYMDSLHAMGQRGGWPLNLFLTPDLRPFYGGTYFPKAGFLQILKQVAGLWIADQDRVQTSANQVRDFLNQQIAAFRKPKRQYEISEDILETYALKMSQGFDNQWGGFGPAPKFPPNVQVPLLLRMAKGGDTDAKDLALKSLVKMAEGGIYDHIGGGFCRYSVDERWEIPHFEKMLYVNALCIDNYIEAYLFSGQEEYRRVAEDVSAYVLRDMTASGGGFFSAEDADSEGHEGRFYVWSYSELEKILSATEMKFLTDRFGVSRGGNFDDGSNNLKISSDDFWAAREGVVFSDIRKKLLAIRENRERPLLDDKQLTSWNGLMIAALSKAARATQNKSYLESAQRAVAFVRDKLYSQNLLQRRYRAGASEYSGTLEDYAFMIHGLIELYQSDFDPKHLAWAKVLQETQNRLFWDDQSAGYFFSSKDEKNLIVRTKEFSDGALPSANSVSVMNLARLSTYFLNSDWREMAISSVSVAAETVNQFPLAYSQLLLANEYLSRDTYELVAIGGHQDPLKMGLGFEPYVLVAGQTSTGESPLPLLKGKTALGGTTYYVCRRGACQKPTLNFKEALQQLSI